MPKNELNNKLNKLKHVQVYNKIFNMIQDGTYSPGMQLPSEPELAGQLNVSRATLRKSLALLQEDHLVKIWLKISEEKVISLEKILATCLKTVTKIDNTPLKLV